MNSNNAGCMKGSYHLVCFFFFRLFCISNFHNTCHSHPAVWYTIVRKGTLIRESMDKAFALLKIARIPFIIVGTVFPTRGSVYDFGFVYPYNSITLIDLNCLWLKLIIYHPDRIRLGKSMI